MTKNDYFAQGLLKVKENEHQKAIELFSLVLKDAPNNADALSQRAVCYLNIAQYELSLFDMNKAVECDPNYSYRYQSRGYLKARMKDYTGAVKDYEKAVELDPSDAIAYNNLALAQEQMGYAKKAKENFDKSDKIQGIKSTEQRANERIEAAKQSETDTPLSEENIPIPSSQNKQIESKTEIAKSVFTKKNSFKEFIRFIGNGFKLKDNDKS